MTYAVTPLHSIAIGYQGILAARLGEPLRGTELPVFLMRHETPAPRRCVAALKAISLGLAVVGASQCIPSSARADDRVEEQQHLFILEAGVSGERGIARRESLRPGSRRGWLGY